MYNSNWYNILQLLILLLSSATTETTNLSLQSQTRLRVGPHLIDLFQTTEPYHANLTWSSRFLGLLDWFLLQTVIARPFQPFRRKVLSEGHYLHKNPECYSHSWHFFLLHSYLYKIRCIEMVEESFKCWIHWAREDPRSNFRLYHHPNPHSFRKSPLSVSRSSWVPIVCLASTIIDEF